MEIIIALDQLKNLDTTSSTLFLNTWKKYAFAIDENLVQLCLLDAQIYDMNHQIMPVVKQALMKHNLIDEVRKHVLSFTSIIDSSCLKKSLPKNLVIILYIGLCNGAGWVCKLRNRPTILLGIEKIIELNWTNPEQVNTLIAHEIGHVIMFELRKWDESYDDLFFQSIYQLFSEGFAEHIESLFVPNTKRRQDDWYDWCIKNEDLIKNSYLDCLKNNQSVQGFFGDWVHVHGQSDLGYYLGKIFIEELTKKHTLLEIGKLSMKQITDDLLTFLTL